MASNAEDRMLRRQIKIFEQEETDRRLKEAGLYDRNYSYEERKQILEVLQESRDQSSSSKVDSSKPKLENSLNKAGGDKESQETTVGSSTKQQEKKQKTDWKHLVTSKSSDEDELEILGRKPGSSAVGLSKTVQRNKFNSQKSRKLADKDDSKKFATAESYGNKMVAAALKKSEQKTVDFPPNPIEANDLLTISKRVNQIIKPENGVEHVKVSPSPDPRKSHPPSPETDDDDFPPALKDRNKSNQLLFGLNQVPKSKALAMKTRARRFSDLLTQVEQYLPLPDINDFESKGSYQKLIETEEQMKKVAQDSSYKFVKWKKLIILNTSNNRRRRRNPLSTSNGSPRYDAQATDAFDIPDSPPASSLRKLDLSSVSPVLESDAPRNKSAIGLSNEVFDTEMDEPIFGSKMTSETKEETQDCPICSKTFPLKVIERHAAECDIYDTDDIQVETRQRPERISTRSTRLRNRNDGAARGSGYEQASEKSDPLFVETDSSDKEESDSDFETNADSGNKRNRKKEVPKIKKRRI